MISSEVPDWTRERVSHRWDHGARLLRCLRGHDAARGRGGLGGRLRRFYWALAHQFWSLATASEIPLGTRIAGGLRLTHPNGVVIHSRAVIGPNCLIMHQVTIGQNRGGVPTLGGHVDVGPGAKILGAVHVGDHAVIGANAVVLRDVPARAVAVGAPARVVRFIPHAAATGQDSRAAGGAPAEPATAPRSPRPARRSAPAPRSGPPDSC